MLKTDQEAADAALDVCADLFIHVVERRLSHTPLFQGGYLSGFGIWSPDREVRTQIDNVTMLSPQTYRERVLPFDRKALIVSRAVYASEAEQLLRLEPAGGLCLQLRVVQDEAVYE